MSFWYFINNYLTYTTKEKLEEIEKFLNDDEILEQFLFEKLALKNNIDVYLCSKCNLFSTKLNSLKIYTHYHSSHYGIRLVICRSCYNRKFRDRTLLNPDCCMISDDINKYQLSLCKEHDKCTDEEIINLLTS